MRTRRAQATLGTVAGFLLGASGGFGPATLGGVASETAGAYDVGLATVGIFTSALIVTHVLVQIPGGSLADRFGARVIGLAGLLFVVAGSLLAAIAPDPALLIAARLVAGVGTGMSFIAGTALVRESGGGPLAQGLYGGVALSFAGLSLVSVPLLYDAWGWRAPFWASLIVALAGVLVVALAGRAGAGRARPEAAPESGGVFGDPRLRRTAILYSLSFGVSFVIAGWATELLERSAGIGGKVAAAIAAAVLALGIVSRPLGGWVLRTFPRHARGAIQASLVAGGIGTAALVAGDPPWLAAAGAIVLGLAAGIPFAAVFTGAALTRPDAPAKAAGFVNATANTVVLVGTPLVGLTFGLPGEGRIGFAALTALWFVALVFLPGERGIGIASGARSDGGGAEP